MNKKIVIVFVCLFMSFLAWAGDKKESNVGSSSSSDKIQANIDDVAILKSKLSELELTSDLRYKHYDEILEAQRFDYGMNVTVLTTIFVGGIALLALVNFGFMRRELKRDIDAAVSLSRGEISSAMESFRKELASTVLTTTQELKVDFTQEVLKNVKNISDGTNERFQKMEVLFEDKIKELEGDNWNALGRIYQETESYGTSTLWHLRSLLKYLAVPNNVGEDWIKLQIGHVKDNLEESKKGMLNEKNLSEIKKAINLIPEDKYRQQKEELMEVFVRKEKELL